MSYSIQEAKVERRLEAIEALKNRDAEHLHRLADIEKGNGEDEYAEMLRDQARKIDAEDWKHDEWVDSQLTE